MIQDVLKKLQSQDPNNPKVAELRKKLASITQEDKQNPAEKKTEPKPQQQPPTKQPSSSSKKKPADDELSKLQKASEQEQKAYAQQKDPQLIVREEKTHRLVAKQVGELIELASDMQKRINALEQGKKQTKQYIERLEKRNKELEENMKVIDGRLEKFMGLYEVITNQYNPFSDKQEENSSEFTSSKLSVSDEITGDNQSVPVAQGTISSENKKKIDQLLADLEHEEKGESKQDLEAQDEIQERQEELSEQVKNELHGLFSSFEQRMREHVNDSVHEKLHTLLGDLETVLDEEVDEAIHEDTESLTSHDDIISHAMKELQALESSTPQEYTQDTKQLQEEVSDIDDQIKAIPESLYFRLKDGRVLKSVDDLAAALEDMSMSVFTHHVNDKHNDFADWLELALKDSRGEKLRSLTQQEMADLLNSSS